MMSLDNVDDDTMTLPQNRHVLYSNTPDVLADIYDEQSNMAVWHRALSPVVSQTAADILASGELVQIVIAVTPKNALAALKKELAKFDGGDALCQDISDLIDMFCCLFEQERVGLRLTGLDRAMCPRFHVDKVPCRLVTTYVGVATQWLEHQAVDRTKLGVGNQGLADDVCGLYQRPSDIKQLANGDVAILKGERWHKNEGGGLVHRSPALAPQSNRLLLTLDFMS